MATLISLLAVGISITLIVVFRVVVWNDERDSLYSEFTPVAIKIVNATSNPYQCADTRGCTCAEAPSESATCTNQKQQLIPGTCGNGWHCCRTVCDTCYRTCYRRCCDRCRRRSKDGSYSLFRTYDCNCRDCNPYDCYPYPCNCRCVQSVSNIRCNTYVSNCYRPSVTFGFVVTGQAQLNANCGDAGCIHYVTKTTDCGIDDTGCVNAYLDQYPIETSINGYYNKNDPDHIEFLDLNFSPSGALIAGIVLGSIALVISFLVFMFLITDRQRTVRQHTSSSTRTSTRVSSHERAHALSYASTSVSVNAKK